MSHNKMVPAIQVSITDADDEAVTSIDGAVEAMRQALGDPNYSAELVEDMGDGLWLVALPTSDAAELRESGYWGRESEGGYNIEAEMASEDTGRGDHFGNCAKCGISYEARSAEQAIEDHDAFEGHAFVPFAPSWQIEIVREDGAPAVGEAEAREVMAALFTQLHGYREPMENQGGGIWLAAIPQPLADAMQGGFVLLTTVTPGNIAYEVTIEMP